MLSQNMKRYASLAPKRVSFSVFHEFVSGVQYQTLLREWRKVAEGRAVSEVTVEPTVGLGNSGNA